MTEEFLRNNTKYPLICNEASINYISALKMRLNIEYLKYDMGYTDKIIFRNNILSTIKKITKEAMELKINSKADILELSRDIVEIELICLIHLSQIESFKKN